MIDIVTSLLLSNTLRFEEGEIKFFESNVCLIPPVVYASLYKELEKQGQEKLLYTTSKDSAARWFTKLASVSNKSSVKELVSFLPKVLNLLAYGRVVIEKEDIEAKYFEVTLEAPLFPVLVGKSKKPVDVVFSGILAGAFSVVTGYDLVCNEEECVALGKGSKCRFVIKRAV